MREILFRGKRLDNGELVEGFYAHFKDVMKDQESHRIYSHFSETDCGDFYPDWFEVDPATVGQYTGLTDKNGKRIFEGDICRIRNFLYKVEFKYSAWNFTILSNKVYCYPAFSSHCGKYCEIIGNIHDIPTLTKNTTP